MSSSRRRRNTGCAAQCRNNQSALLKARQVFKTHYKNERPFTVSVVYNENAADSLKKCTVIVTAAGACKASRVFHNVKKVHAGDNSDHTGFESGSSCLLELPGNICVFIGHKMYEFELMGDETVVEYFTYVNSGVAYPVLVGSKFVYFMLDRVAIYRPFMVETVHAMESSGKTLAGAKKERTKVDYKHAYHKYYYNFLETMQSVPKLFF